MGRRIITLYVEDAMIEMAKAKRINISALLRNVLDTELKIKELPEATTSKEIINKLKFTSSQLTTELKLKTKECEKLEKKVRELSKDLEEAKEKKRDKDNFPKGWSHKPDED